MPALKNSGAGRAPGISGIARAAACQTPLASLVSVRPALQDAATGVTFASTAGVIGGGCSSTGSFPPPGSETDRRGYRTWAGRPETPS